MSQDEALENMKQNIIEICRESDGTLLLETGAGQGTEMLTNIDDFINFALEMQNIVDNFGICVDTCHVCASGYSPTYYLEECLERGVKVKLLHYNDSCDALRSRKDRHEKIGMGKIDWFDLYCVAMIASRNNIDIVDET